MGNFCRYCGKPLVNGACDCQMSAAQRSEAAEPAAQTFPAQQAPGVQQNPQDNMGQQMNYQQAPNDFQQQMNYQQAPNDFQQQMNYQQPYQQMAQPSMQSQMAKTEAMAAKNLFIELIRRPCTALYQVIPQNKVTGGIIIGVVHLFLLWICTIINIPIPMINTYLSNGDKSKIGLILVLIAGIPIVVMSLAGYLVGKQKNPGLTFKAALGVFGSATAPGSVLFFAAFLFGLISPAMAAILMLLCYFSWLYMSMEAMNVINGNRRDFVFLIVLVLQIVCILVLTLLAKKMIVDAIKDTVGSLKSLTDLLDFF